MQEHETPSRESQIDDRPTLSVASAIFEQLPQLGIKPEDAHYWKHHQHELRQELAFLRQAESGSLRVLGSFAMRLGPKKSLQVLHRTGHFDWINRPMDNFPGYIESFDGSCEIIVVQAGRTATYEEVCAFREAHGLESWSEEGGSMSPDRGETNVFVFRRKRV
ncbi:MAG: hypothetical protein A3B23_00270 [Candidatus Colwellbacteria bacterium RIFCSPLOWO2_01_FULL_48_10]|uniref:Uncharacterized protein n=1 Tax=Candidatus Colwellbacteria bacterium RIFCSPLOWO2_01_FULL_48_10 TaxID=1797690 RepID=A0A1G1Z5E2_9BACT|nr:MAG: hypothetical protein A3B23_00270 [Candidatus Colwellbacteria bacterium RIFCSPLOWO2_01_FULL_48_10]